VCCCCCSAIALAASLRKGKGQYLPNLSPQQKQQLRGSLDFIAANAFTAKWVSAKPGSDGTGWQDSKTSSSGQLIGAATGVPWMNVVPWSQAKMLQYLSKRYSTAILISSSGTQVPGEEGQTLPNVLQDTFRIEYYRAYLDSVCSAVASGSTKVLGWYAWSLFDGFEWTDGFTRKFGLVHVSPDLKRTPKSSSQWLSQHFFKQGA
jgi:beta-glucosidase